MAPFCHHADFIKHGPQANDDQIDYHSADHYSCDYNPDQWMAREGFSPSQSLVSEEIATPEELGRDTPESQPMTACVDPAHMETSDDFDIDRAFADPDYEFEPTNQPDDIALGSARSVRDDDQDEFMMLVNNKNKWHREMKSYAAQYRD